MQHPSPLRYLQSSWRDLEVGIFGGFQDSFLKPDLKNNWAVSHHHNSAEIFKSTAFHKRWIEVVPSGLRLYLTNNQASIDSQGLVAYHPPCRGSEVRSIRKFSYGKFRVRMQTPAESGVISSFFLYDPESRDEIDIEFGHFKNGRTQLQCNYFVAGVGGNEHVHELSFDPAKDMHTYGFEWTPSGIRWFTEEGTVCTYFTRFLLRNPMHLYMNVWAPHNGHEWVGKYDGKTSLATYEWVSYHPTYTT